MTANQFKVGKFTSNRGNVYEITEIVTNTMLNTFCDEPIMYDVKWGNGGIRTFSPRGIRSIIKNS
jgi:hypothetical protein